MKFRKCSLIIRVYLFISDRSVLLAGIIRVVHVRAEDRSIAVDRRLEWNEEELRR